VKLALQFGVPLVPCYCFGEADLYTQSAFLLGLRKWLVKAAGIAVTFACGPSVLAPWRPYPVKLVHCVGPPVPLPPRFAANAAARRSKVSSAFLDPGREDVDAYHAAYVAALVKVFDANKAANGYPDAALVIK